MSVFGDGRMSTHADPAYALLRYTAGFRRPALWPIRPILGFWDSKVPQNVRFPAPDADEPLCKI